MLFVTFVIIIIYTVSKLLLTKNKIPFHIERAFTVVGEDNKDIPVKNLSFNGIPAIVYGSYDSNSKITNKLISNINNTVSNNEEFEYYYINQDDARLYISENFEPKLLTVYDSLSLIDKNNLWKYCILYKNGGIYMDINLGLKDKLINLISPMLKSLPENNNVIFTKNNNSIAHKLIIAPPGLPIFKELIDSFINNNIVTLNNLIKKYNYEDNIKFYIDDNYIKSVDTNEICFQIN